MKTILIIKIIEFVTKKELAAIALDLEKYIYNMHCQLCQLSFTYLIFLIKLNISWNISQKNYNYFSKVY